MPEIFSSASRKSQPKSQTAPTGTGDPFSASQVEFQEEYRQDQHEDTNTNGNKNPNVGRSEYDSSYRKKQVSEYSEVIRVEKPSQNPLDAFAAQPEKTFFDSQEREEQVILLLRQHPITQVKWILITLGLIIFPFLFSLLPFSLVVPSRFALAGLVGWYLLITGFVIESFLGWFFNVYIITDERVIDVDFISLIYKNVSAAKIDNIEDVTAVTGGAIRSIFDMGTVIVQTAGAQQQIEFEDVPHPAKVTKLLNELLLEEEREKIEGRVN